MNLFKNMESQQTIIHIGYHKCASTYLQHQIFPNLNVNYIPLLGQNKKMLHYCEETSNFSPSVFSTWVDARKNQLNKTTILSSEGLSGHMNGYKNPDPFLIANNLKSTYPNGKILIVIRNQFNYLRSLYAFRVLFKGSETRSFQEFILQEGEQGLFKKLAYHHLVEHYINLFGKKNVLVLPIELLAKDNKNFINKIADFLSLNIDSQSISNNPVNPSTKNKHTINFVRKMNTLFKTIFIFRNKQNINNTNYNAFKRKIVPLIDLFFKKNKQYFHIPQKIEQQLTKKYHISNLHLQSLIDVDLSKYGYAID